VNPTEGIAAAASTTKNSSFFVINPPPPQRTQNGGFYCLRPTLHVRDRNPAWQLDGDSERPFSFSSSSSAVTDEPFPSHHALVLSFTPFLLLRCSSLYSSAETQNEQLAILPFPLSRAARRCPSGFSALSSATTPAAHTHTHTHTHTHRRNPPHLRRPSLLAAPLSPVELRRGPAPTLLCKCINHIPRLPVPLFSETVAGDPPAAKGAALPLALPPCDRGRLWSARSWRRMERRCNRCKEWEGHAYWSAKKRFWFPLQGNFIEESRIPGKFVRNFEEKWGEFVHLTGPSEKTWHVNLKNVSGIMFFGDGWEDFVEENLLEEYDLLLFKYKGNSQFKVTIFDKSGCEKTSAYLIKECNHPRTSKGSVKGTSASEDSISVLPTHRPRCPVIDLTVMESNSSGPQKKKHQNKRRHKKPKVESDSSSMQPDESHDRNTRSERGAFVKSSYGNFLLSNRRPVTQEEIEKASKRAMEFQSDNPFFWKPMKATHVYRGFFMAVPKEFAAEYLPSEKAKVTLRTPHGKERWVVSFRKEKCSYGFSGDWRKFVQDNHLEEGDACVFELKGSKKEIIMHVHIFRVVELESLEPPQMRRFRR
ncbi:hypothetical protein Taro_043471, partial [Colocasia esculenta]|nr:hypothetical protein [Colocasia esculenta]